MRLSDLVAGMGLWIFPVVGLLGFFAAFVVVVMRVSRASDDEMTASAGLPLVDGTEASVVAGKTSGCACGGETCCRGERR